jgi:hypothetical protein
MFGLKRRPRREGSRPKLPRGILGRPYAREDVPVRQFLAGPSDHWRHGSVDVLLRSANLTLVNNIDRQGSTGPK